MKNQRTQLFFFIIAALLSIPAKEYSDFLAGIILGAAVINIISILIKSMNKKTA